MNKVVMVIVALVVVIGGFFILNNYILENKQSEKMEFSTDGRDIYLSQFEDDSIELAFDYPDGPDGYVIDDLSSFVGVETQGVEVVKVYSIMNAKDKLELENSEGGREGPPAMQVMVFRNDKNQSASVWVDAFPVFSNINMVLEEVDRDAVVGGANAVRYTTDGLYVTDNAVVASGDFVYHFSGSYHERDSVIHQDFKAMLDSVRFIQSADVKAGAKIDVEVACKSALAYMLFQSGEDSDKFIKECINGEHPDVIERYINDMGLDGASV